MSAIRSSENKTEVSLRRALHALGLRYRKNVRGVVGKPDIVFANARVAVFVDGDYWHGRLLRERGLRAVKGYYSADQRSYWLQKLQRNVARDDYVTTTLRDQGWLVLRYWESDIKLGVNAAAREIATQVQNRRAELLVGRGMRTLGSGT